MPRASYITWLIRCFYSTFPHCNEIAACGMGVIWISCLRTRKDTIAPQRETTIVSARNANRVRHVYRHSHTRVNQFKSFSVVLCVPVYICLRKKVVFFLRTFMQRYCLANNFNYFYFELFEREEFLSFKSLFIYFER